jgi:POTRA domain, FtsQ-type
VPAIAPRLGSNSKKEATVRRTRKRTKQAGILRGTWIVLRNLILVGTVVGLLAALSWIGFQAFERNGLLVLRQVDVIGNRLLPKAAILEKAGLELGVKLPSVRPSLVEAALHDLPGIGEVEVRRMFPSRIEIRVKEKDPVAMGFAKGWFGLASDGTRISGLDWSSSDLPVVDAFAMLDSSRRATLGSFLQLAKLNYPTLYANFSQLSMRGKGDDAIEIILRDGRLKVLLALKGPYGAPVLKETQTKSESNKSLNSLEFLQALMHQQSASLEPGNTIDLRVEGLAYVH